MSRNLDKECAGQGQLSSAWDWDWVMGYGLWVMGIYEKTFLSPLIRIATLSHCSLNVVYCSVSR